MAMPKVLWHTNRNEKFQQKKKTENQTLTFELIHLYCKKVYLLVSYIKYHFVCFLVYLRMEMWFFNEMK